MFRNLGDTNSRTENKLTTQSLDNKNKNPVVLTVIPVSTEELVVPQKIGSTAEIPAFVDEDFLNQPEIIDNHTWRWAQVDPEDVPVNLTQGGEGLEGRPVLAQKVQATDDGPRSRTRWTLGVLAVRSKPPQEDHDAQRHEREHVRRKHDVQCEQTDRYPLYDGQYRRLTDLVRLVHQ